MSDTDLPVAQPSPTNTRFNLCDPALAAADIINNSTDKEHMRVRLECELNRWKDALATALSSTPSDVNKWQPIKTAPKDGQRILIAWTLPEEMEVKMDVVFWNASRKMWSASDGGWGTDRWPDSGDDAPTHWMPLPEPPTATDVEQKERR